MRIWSYITSLFDFIRFGLAGLVGAFAGFSFYFILVDHQKVLTQNQGMVLSFLIAVTVNYFVHFFWTFKEKETKKVTINRYLYFIIISLFGFGINWLIFRILMTYLTFSLIQKYSIIALICSTGISALSNYFFSSRLIFLLKKK